MALIARDEARQIERCFGSWWDHVDQVILVDTGSTDGTVEAAEGFAAARGEPDKLIVERFEWVDDFSKARQASWDLAGADFTVWCDLDDTLRGAGNIRALAAQMPANVNAYLCQYEYAHDDAGNVTCRLERERIIRRSARQAWRLPVHEILDVDGEFARTSDVVWVHHREHDKRSVPERNLRILQADAEKAETAGEPVSPRTLIYLGTELLALGRPADAVPWLERYLEAPQTDEEACQCAHKLSIAHRALCDTPEKTRVHLPLSETAAHQAIGHRPDWGDGYIDLAEINIRREKWDTALRWVEKAQGCGTPETLLIINPMDYTYQPVVMASVCMARLGRLDQALEATERALAVTPGRGDLVAQRDALSVEIKNVETVKHVLALYELLVRHDEPLKARALLDNAPYYVRDHPLICEARRNVREMTLHATDPAVYSRFYREDARIFVPFEHHGKPISEAGGMFPRAARCKAVLESQAKARASGRPLRVLDLSAHDGWMAAYVTSTSDCAMTWDLVDMNPDAVEGCSKRRREYPGIGRAVCDDLHNAPERFTPGSYDAVVCCETIEHVPDVDRLLGVMETMCAPGGRVHLSTPDGAYERGDIPGWNKVEPKGHLRAIRPQDMAALMCERGIADNFEVLPDKTIYVAYQPSPRKGKVVFYAGGCEPRPEAVLAGGQGGSETALCKMAEAFARQGYDVRVHAGQGEGGLRSDQVTTNGAGPLKGQVLYQPVATWDPGETCDLFISSRCPETADRSVNADRQVLWLHDADYGDRITPARAARFDGVIVLSQWQREHFLAQYPFLRDKLVLSRNGIETTLFDNPLPVTERKPWVVYSSSPDRGLDVLLEVWPEVRARVPDAELHHTYAPVYHQFKAQYPHLQEFHRKLDGLHEGIEGVVQHHSMGQAQLADLYKRARCWAYPSYTGWLHRRFPEIYCITAVECQAAGCVPVALSYAALRETVVSGELIPGDPMAPEWRARFVDGIVRALTDDEWAAEQGAKGRAFALDLGWQDVAGHWAQLWLTSHEAAVA